ncbi:MAG: hypothetical protein Fur0019_13160 [Tibeticola sp.]
MSSLSDYIGDNAKVWESGRQYKRGQIVLSPADNYQAWVRIGADGGGTTDPSQDSANYRPFGARPIKSIQRGVVDGSQSSFTISPVNMNKSVLTWTGGSFTNSDGSTRVPRFEFTNSTTITVNGASGLGGSASWQIVEYY